ncbi:hypothetical protein JQ604_31285 [Bradyrhizobium jicamae]|uniref:hypothetical protein n=1 Tax=Bradyrhizobium jicamae TaxID=280332 RepID=UPI001BA541E8|nr:hypothetical protein [Bradyrhizobium jicamae]MBR0756685.1 hypothetical protein [Bradyrhizobium jicamae]
MIWLGLFFLAVSLFFFGRAWKESQTDDSILWKWCSRLIWFGSIGGVQVIEFRRYLEGLTYRPFFALFAGVLLGVMLWIFGRMIASANLRPR